MLTEVIGRKPNVTFAIKKNAYLLRLVLSAQDAISVI